MGSHIELVLKNRTRRSKDYNSEIEGDTEGKSRNGLETISPELNLY